jgi:hypothetical protein
VRWCYLARLVETTNEHGAVPNSRMKPLSTQRQAKLIICIGACVVLTIFAWFAIGQWNRQCAIAAKKQYVKALRQQMHLPDSVSPLSFVVEQLQQQISKDIPPEQLDNYVPPHDRSEIIYDVDGRLLEKTYYFLPRKYDRHFFMGFWLSIRYSKDGRISSVVMED